MSSWENPPYRDAEAYDKLCAESEASDFYFCVLDNLEVTNGYTMVALVPKLYFHVHGCMWDQSMFLDHILPEDLMECMESCWDTNRDAQEVRRDMLSRGFEEHYQFSELVTEDYD